MSIYDNLANSDFVDAGKFKQQLEKLVVSESIETVQQPMDEEVPKNDANYQSNIDLPGPRYDQNEELQAMSLLQNPLENFENEQSIRQKFKNQDQSQGMVRHDEQVQTAHFTQNKAQEKVLPRVNTEQTQRTLGKQGPTSASEGHLIDVRAMLGEDGDYEDSEQRARAEKVRQIMANNATNRNDQGDTGQFGGGKDTSSVIQAHSRLDKSAQKARENQTIQVEQFKVQEMQESPQLKNRLDADTDKINQILAQLQEPMAPEQREIKSRSELERAHAHMQQSIKQMRLDEQPSDFLALKIQKSDVSSPGNQKPAIQSSLYELATKAGQPTTNTMSDDELKLLQGESMGSYNQKLNQMLNVGSERNMYSNQVSRDEQPSQTSAMIAQLDCRNFVGLSPIDGSQEFGLDSKQVFQDAGQQLIKEKENFNEKNFQMPQQTLQEYMQSVNPPKNQTANQDKLSIIRQKLNMQAQPPKQSQSQRPSLNPKEENYRQRFIPNLGNEQYNSQVSFQNPVQNQSSRQQHVQDQASYNSRGSQPNLSNQSKRVDFSQTDKDVKIEKRMQLLANFDDIPIHQLHKADGYQVRNLAEEERMNQGHSALDDTETKKMSLKDQCFHKNWKVRSTAFKEITQLMMDYNPAERENATKEDLMYGDLENPFDNYGIIIDQMLKDSNLIAQFDGYNCLLTYCRLNPGDIKAVVQATTSLMLDKLQITKANFREITMQILQVMLQRRQSIISDLLKRFKSVNPKMSQFCFESIIKAFEENSLHMQDANLKLMFKCTHDMLAHSSRELRDLAHTLMAHIYENCEDDLSTFCSHIKSLRPIQLKELKDSLSEYQKRRNDFQVRLFIADASTGNQGEQEMADRSHSREPVRTNIESGVTALGKQMSAGQADKEEASDLNLLVPEQFNELPRLTNIKQKQKGMESFNAELEKLKKRDNLSVKVKDYQHIYNVTASLLEDPNMLVFIEAIKTVEHLSLLLNKNMKKEKAKQFLLLLGSKYQETKTAVLTALAQVFEVVLYARCISFTLFFDTLVNQVVAVHKNPRVRQMVLERVTILMAGPQDKGLGFKQTLSILKAVKDKLLVVLSKDTNSQVRDQAAVLLSLLLSQANTSDSEEAAQIKDLLAELIEKLPQRRQTEISRKADELGQEEPIVEEPIETARSDRPPKALSGAALRAGASQERKKRPNDSITTNEDPLASSVHSEGPNFLTKKSQAAVSGRFQAQMSDIVLTIKNIAQENDRLRVQQISSNLETALLELQEEGVKECKQHIVSCFNWLVSSQTQKVNFLTPDRQESLKAVLAFLSQMYQVDRSISTKIRSAEQDPVELVQVIQSCQVCQSLLQNDAEAPIMISQVLDQVILAVEQSNLPLQAFINVFKKVLISQETPLLNKQLPNSRAIMLSNAIYYLSDRMEDLLDRSKRQVYDGQALQAIQLRDFEDLRMIVIQVAEQGFVSGEDNIHLLSQALTYLKDRMQASTDTTTGQQTLEQTPVSGMQEDRAMRSADAIFKVVLDQLQNNFERGLLLLKDLVKDEQSGVIPALKFDHRQEIASTLLNFIVNGYASPADQYKQAYSLKALLWLREEFIGLEDAFKLSAPIMAAYAQAKTQERDCSIEKYLLDNWVAALSLRDTIDRVAFTLKDQHLDQEAAFAHLVEWLSERLDEWQLEDLRKLVPSLATGLLKQSDENKAVALRVLDIATDRFGPKKVKEFMETQLLHENALLIKFVDFFDSNYAYLLKQEAQSEHLKISQTNQGDDSLVEPLLTGRSGTQNTSRFNNNKQVHSEAEFEDTLNQEKVKYQQIMQKLDGLKKNSEVCITDEQRQTLIESNIQPNVALLKRQSASQKGRERPISGRYEGEMKVGQLTNKEGGTLSQFNEDEDFRLSTEHQVSIAQLGGLQSQKSSIQNLASRRGLNTATVTDEDDAIQVGHQAEQANKRSYQSTQQLGEGLRAYNSQHFSPAAMEMGEQAISGHKEAQMKVDEISKDDLLRSSRQQIKESFANQEEKMARLESSQIKVRQFKSEMEALVEEKRKLEYEMQRLLEDKDESIEWRKKHDQVAAKNQDIVASLADANEQYLQQVSENEKLTSQISEMQQEHRDFLCKYKRLEEMLAESKKEVEIQRQKLNEESVKNEVLAASSRGSNWSDHVVQEKQMLAIEEAFESDSSDLCIKKVQELLLDSEHSNLSKPLSFHYQKLKAKDARMEMLNGLKTALENEDILFAVSVDSYKSLLNFLLRAFSFEKELIERESLASQHEREQQNELTQESQRLISKLLNSKEFTTSLIVLIQLLKSDAMPSDFKVQLSILERHYLRVTMRCISRITKALHSESPELVRAFDVLVEMQKLFQKHPPEQLSQDLPCLADFDYVYRGLKDVSDKMIELQPQKCQSFLDFCKKDQQTEQKNAFIKYLMNVLLD